MNNHPYLLDKVNRKLVPVKPEKPSRPDITVIPSGSDDLPTHSELMREYEREIAALPTPIPISDSWNIENEPEGKEYEVGKNFHIKCEVYYHEINIYTNQPFGWLTAPWQAWFMVPPGEDRSLYRATAFPISTTAGITRGLMA